MTLKLVLSTVAAASIASQAAAFLAENALIVRATGVDSFDVPYRGQSGPGDFWCAAGDYVIRELNRPVNTKIYRTSSPPRRGGQGMSFSLQPSGAKKTGLALFAGGPGVSASHARSLCDVPRLTIDD